MERTGRARLTVGAEHGPLTGLLVADFSRVLAGPLAAMFLGDLGATVVKVERPGTGDDSRAWGPPYVGTMSSYFASVNRNKRSVALSLDDPVGRDLARRLASRADVLIENFRPGRLAAFGLDATSVLELNPAIVYCSVSGFGSEVGADIPGYDFVTQAVGGLMSITGEPAGEPTKVGVAIVDVLTGLHATIAILAAVRDRDRSGRGQHVEVNLLSSMLASLVNQGTSYLNGSGVPAAMGNRHPSIAPYETIAACDAPVALAVGNDRQFQLLCEVLGMSELAADERFRTNSARVAHRAALMAALEPPFLTDTADSWTSRLRAVGVPCGPVNDLAGAFELAETLGLRPIIRFPEAAGGLGVSTMANPIRFAGTPVSYHRAPPTLGQDTEEVKAWLATL